MATEKRLIDANALKSIFDKRYDDAFMQSHTRPNIAWWEGYSSGVNWGRNTISDVPIVDAVPVDDIRLLRILIDNEGVPEAKLQIGDRYILLRGDPVDVREVVHGEWKPVKYNAHCSCGKSYGTYHYLCSACNRISYAQPYGLNYCPNCGADMRERMIHNA